MPASLTVAARAAVHLAFGAERAVDQRRVEFVACED
jgi:hypothetical protein